MEPTANFEELKRSLGTVCPMCFHIIEPTDIKRINHEEIECPLCRFHFQIAGVNDNTL